MATKKSNPDLRRFRTLVVLTIVFTILSIACTVGSRYLTEDTYRTYVGISASTVQDERIATYTAAIELAPEKLDAYQLLLGVYGEDGVFGKNESEQFLAAYNANHTSLEETSQEFAELQSMIGFLYINGYEDTSAVTRLRMALPFLKIANGIMTGDHEQKSTVNCYCQIGTFYEDYIWNASSVHEITEPVMEELISGIEDTLSAFLADTSAESVYNMLGFEVAVCDLLFDQRDILAETVAKDRIIGILNDIYRNQPDLKTLQKEQTKQLLHTLRTNRSSYFEMVERAYSRKGESS